MIAAIALDELQQLLAKMPAELKSTVLAGELGTPVSRLDLAVLGAAILSSQSAMFNVLLEMEGHTFKSLEHLKHANEEVARFGQLFMKTARLDDIIRDLHRALRSAGIKIDE